MNCAICRRVFVRLARGNERSLPISSLHGVVCVDGIELMLERSDQDEGIKERNRIENTFYCRLTRDGWLEANGKAKVIERTMEPNCSNDLNSDGDVLLLLSYDGRW